MKKFVTVAFLATAAAFTATVTPASATDWAYVGETSTDTQYVDKDSARDVTDGVYSVWMRYEYKRARRDGVSAMLSRTVIDCRDMTSATVHITTYYPSGRVANSFEYENPEWSRMIPGSSFGDFHSKLCDAAYGRRY